MNLPRRTLGLIIVLLAVTAVLLLVAFSAGKKTAENTTIVGNRLPPPPPPLSQAKTTLVIQPNPYTVTGNLPQTVQIIIDTSTNKVKGVQLELSYDPTIITNVSVAPGTFLKNASPLKNTVDTAKGQVDYWLTLPPGIDGVSGTGIVAVVQFTPTGIKKTTRLQLLPTSIVIAQGVSPSVLKSATGADITFGAPSAQGAQ